MAENKKSFVAYCDWGEMFDDLTNDEAGKLVKHLFDYVRDKNPKSDRTTELLFISIKQSLKRDLKKYEQYIDKQRVNGSKGGRPKKTQKTQPFSEKPKKADSVSVSVNDSDINYKKLLDFFNQVTGKKSRVINDKTKGQVNSRIKEGYTKDDIAKAIQNCYDDDYHIKTEHKYLTLEFITRADKLEKYSTIKNPYSEKTLGQKLLG